MGLVVKSQIAGIVKEESQKQNAGVDNVTSDFAPMLDKKVRELISAAVKRAQENHRKTLMGRDI